MMSAHDEAVGEMGVAVRADAVGGEELARGVAVEGVGLAAVVEADDIRRGRDRAAAQTSIQPSASGCGSCMVMDASAARGLAASGSWRFTW